MYFYLLFRRQHRRSGSNSRSSRTQQRGETAHMSCQFLIFLEDPACGRDSVKNILKVPTTHPQKKTVSFGISQCTQQRQKMFKGYYGMSVRCKKSSPLRDARTALCSRTLSSGHRESFLFFEKRKKDFTII